MSSSFKKRASHCLATPSARLLQLCDEKKSNLAISADVTTASELLLLAEKLGPEICIFKTHMDIITDFTPELTKALRKLADQHQFLLFEDRKFADIGNTVKQQFTGGIYHIALWADIINAHSLPGPGIIEGLFEGLTGIGRHKNCGLLLIAEMSSKGHLMNEAYRLKTLQLARSYPDFVMGFITQHPLSKTTADECFLNVTPGVQLDAKGDTLGQQYVTPEKAIIDNGADIIIVGRGIIAAKDPAAMAKEYRERAWNSYLKRSEIT